MQTINRVLIIGWDGAGTFVQAAYTPRLDRLAEQGAFTFQAQTATPTISAQCWGTLLHGVHPEKHGLTNDKAAKMTFPEDSPYPSIFKLTRDTYPDAKLASFSAWEPINYGIIESSIGVHKVSNPDDHEVALAAAQYIQDNPDFKLMYIDLDWPDAAGHRHGFNTPEQLRAIEETDKNTGLILDAMEQAGLLEDSLIMIVTDHGGGGAKARDHGSEHALDKTIFWGCAGPGVDPGSTLEDAISIVDSAAVVAYALGLKTPDMWDAKLPGCLFQHAIRGS